MAATLPKPSTAHNVTDGCTPNPTTPAPRPPVRHTANEEETKTNPKLKNTIPTNEGKNQTAIEMAANRLMPPQFGEFCEALNGGNMSDSTRKYWTDFYEFLCEVAEDTP